MSSSISAVEFYFDPVCPWTWLTSRWLYSVADQRGFIVKLRALSLKLLNSDGGNEIPEKFRPGLEMSYRALRLVEHLANHQDFEASTKFYTELGNRLFIEKADPGDDLLQDALKASSLTDLSNVLDDESCDQLIRTSHDLAIESAGPDIGSPVIRLEPDGTTIFGPILSPVPLADECLVIFDATLELARCSSFYELKRGRSGPPDFS